IIPVTRARCMASEDTYTRTESGRAEAEAQFSLLSAELKDLLSLVEGRETFPEVWRKAPQFAEARLRAALDELVAMGHLQKSSAQAPAPETDIARYLTRPV